MRLQLIHPALFEHVDEQRAFNAQVMEATKAMDELDTSTPEGLAWVRQAMEPGGLFGFVAYDFPEVRSIPGPAGDIPIRVLTPDRVTGVYLHLHGGAMTVGSAISMDARNWDFAKALDVAVVSVDYRLAPEHPYPAGPDDCEAAAVWLVEHALAEFGTDRLLIGGESAGAYFALLTLLRLRDRHGSAHAFRGADLCYGVYDLLGTPSRRLLVGKVPYATPDDGRVRKLYTPGMTDDEVRHPDVSPLWAELHDLPPCLVTVGTADSLIDENLYLAARMAIAGTPVDLAVYPEGPHGIESSPTTMGRIARQRIYDFLSRSLSALPG